AEAQEWTPSALLVALNVLVGVIVKRPAVRARLRDRAIDDQVGDKHPRVGVNGRAILADPIHKAEELPAWLIEQFVLDGPLGTKGRSAAIFDRIDRRAFLAVEDQHFSDNVGRQDEHAPAA